MLRFTNKGLYCPPGDFYIDPWRGVNKAIITHAHSDHARAGSNQYLCHHFCKPLLQLRLGSQHTIESLGWNEPLHIHGVKISFHPAGHIIGSAQVRLEYRGEVWVITGDYKLENDGLSEAWEPVKCHTLVTESTFGLPIYQWRPQAEIFAHMTEWIKQNQSENRSTLLLAYSLGKAQRILKTLSAATDRILVHGAIWNVHKTLVEAGWQLPEVVRVTPEMNRKELKGCVVIAPPGAAESSWSKRFGPLQTGACSGWMQVRGNVRRKNVDAGFALSDHCDWPSLLIAIRATEASRIYVTHGFQSVLSRYLNEQGLEAYEVKTEFGREEESEIEDPEGHDTTPSA